LRTSIHKEIVTTSLFKSQLLTWAQQFREVLFLDGNDYPQKYSSYDCILAVDAFTSITTDYHNAFEDIKQYQQTSKDWIFGYLSYDLKNDTEELNSANFDGLQFPDLFFFQPKKLFLLKDNRLEIQYLNLCDEEVEADFYSIFSTKVAPSDHSNSIAIEPRISKDLYVQKVTKMLEYINKGAIYEANFCMEFYADASINPLDKYFLLNTISKPPFAAFLKNDTNFLISASPERYLKKEGTKIISQPIKGTSKRYSDNVQDEISKSNLVTDPKERSENIMITDLVRNDLSRTAQKGSVEVEELCGIYSFLQVHQMISTITSNVDIQYTALDTIKYSFPMGSMTGAPKISAMNIIEELEETKRGLYSGSVGYFTPNGDFDFNVVIRSILYNRKNNYVSFSVGSAITALSIPELEYEECLLKANAMIKVLNCN
jgi:para-aminobenzoate synthetase component 1